MIDDDRRMLPKLVRLILALAAALMVPFSWPQNTVHARQLSLSKGDLAEVEHASNLAARSPYAAINWLSHRQNATQAALGADRKTVLVTFADGYQIAIVGQRGPSLVFHHIVANRLHPYVRVRAQSGGKRAVVLQPFADELNLGAEAGRPEAGALTAAGFSVDLKRNGQVTVPVMASLAAYSVVYLETHSGVLPNGDAIVVTGESNFGPYAALAPTSGGGDGSLMQALVAGDPTHTLYIAITSTFVQRHVGQFPADSIVFLNGCSLLRAPVFWSALHGHGVTSMISWDEEAVVNVTEPAGKLVTDELAQGDSVAQSVQGAVDAGLGIIQTLPTAHLGFLGDGSNTLKGPSPTPTSTPQPVSTQLPTPTRVPTTKPVVHRKKRQSKKCAHGKHRVHGKCVKIRHPARNRR